MKVNKNLQPVSIPIEPHNQYIKMTPKEATDKSTITKQVVINTPTSARLLPITADEKVIDEIQQALTELEELKRPPTSDEVCEVLSDYFGFDYYYQDGYFYRSNGIKYIYPIKVSGFIEIQMYDGHLPLHLIMLIGRFYEGLEEK